MTQITLGLERKVTFRVGTPPAPGDPYNTGHFEVDMGADGLAAARRVFIFRFSDFPGFVRELADGWRGWDGTRVWESPEHDLTLAASHSGHVRLEVTLRDDPVPTWSATTSVEVEPGEEMARFARAAQELCGGG